MTARPLADGWVDERSDAVFRRVLDPYRAKRSIYLTSARVALDEGRVHGQGTFSIQESAYIDDTGHFNAAEFIISYNQLMYYSLAVTVKDHLLPAFSSWSLEDYWARQLPDVLIHKQASTFSRPINARAYTGEFVITELSTRSSGRGLLWLNTEVNFRDDDAGRAVGTVALALVNIPRP